MKKSTINFEKTDFESVTNDTHAGKMYFNVDKVPYLIFGNGYYNFSKESGCALEYLRIVIKENGFPKKGKLEITLVK